MEILKIILDKLPKEVVNSVNFEASDIIIYTSDKDFFINGEEKIKEIVKEIKKRIELRASKEILLDKENAEKLIKKIVPEDAKLTRIHFDENISTVFLHCENPSVFLANNSELLRKIRNETFWKPRIRRVPKMKSKIGEGIINFIYKSSLFRKRFLNLVGKRIYKNWSNEKKEELVRITFLGGAREVGRSALLLYTPESRVLLDCGIDISTQENRFPIFNVPEFNLKELDAIIVTHSHLDHSGLVPYMYKVGYRGPVYMTEPVRDTTALLALDYISVTYKQASSPLYSVSDIKKMIKHSVILNYKEVSDITSDLRITFFNSGHSLGSCMVHINIGNGYHNLLYTSDFKYGKTRLFDIPTTKFARLETLIMEGTYGGKEDKLQSRKESERLLIEYTKRTLERDGKVLLPVLGVGRSQDVMLIIKEAMESGLIPKVPIYLDGMVWDITALHAAYPEFLNYNLRKRIYSNEEVFSSELFYRVGSQKEREEVINGGKCIIISTSGMLVGGASLEYFKHLASEKNNSIIFTSYQSPKSLGRKIKEGLKEVILPINGNEEKIPVKLEVFSIEGLSGHSDREQLISFVSNLRPFPKRILLNHGELNKLKDLASTLNKLFKVETSIPRQLEAIRII
ncbi:MAG: beta-CASP ribonuclease aCPSF1 [Candidatus Pacearchaeota archaeon]